MNTHSPTRSIQSNYFECHVFGKKDLTGVNKDADDERRRDNEKVFLSNYFNTDPEYIFFLKQEHGDKILHIDNYSENNSDTTYFDTGDAMFTEIPGLLLCIRTADCLPVFFTAANKDRRLAGIIHAGWRGLANGIVGKTLRMAEEQFNYKPEHFSVFFGPSAGGSSYQVQEDVAQLFKLKYKNSDNSYMLDLRKNAILELEKYQQIHDDFYDCTMKRNDLFYSHRKGDRERNLNVIYLRK
jgi:hypothetical protein